MTDSCCLEESLGSRQLGLESLPVELSFRGKVWMHLRELVDSFTEQFWGLVFACY
jgi:hypothetical protein